MESAGHGVWRVLEPGQSHDRVREDGKRDQHADATRPWSAPTGYYGEDQFLDADRHYFGYFWWGDRREAGESDYHTVANKGRYVYCSPQGHVLIVRTGVQYGIASTSWIRLFRQLADGLE